MPRVSVIIPAYNAAATIERTIESVRRQTLPDFEIVVIDDGSTDDTAMRARAIADPRLEVHSHPRGSLPAARNRGIAVARGEYLIAYRIDRLWPPTPDGLCSPTEAGPLSYQPAMWYRHLWPRMKAFALPTFSEGYVRLNVKGREAQGVVELADYQSVCDQVAVEIEGLTDARSGRPLVAEVRRTRDSPMATGHLPDPDLIVRWRPGATDVVDAPTTGRIGPLPYCRAGSHTEEGFLWLSGPGIEPGMQLPDGRPTSLAPTFLRLMGAPIPPHMQRPPLLSE